MRIPLLCFTILVCVMGSLFSIFLAPQLFCMQKRIAQFDQDQNEEFSDLLKLKIPADQKFDMARHSKLVEKQAGPTPNDSFPYPHYFLRLPNNDFVLLVKLLSADKSQYIGVLLPFTIGKQAVDPIFFPDALADTCYQYCEWAQKKLAAS